MNINKTTRAGALAIAVTTLAGILSASPTAAVAQGRSVHVSSGTTVPIVLDSPNQISSLNSHSGQRFIAHVLYTDKDRKSDNYGSNNLPNGTKVYGHITTAVARNGSQTGFLGLAFDKVVLPSGAVYPVQAVPGDISGDSVDVRSDGSVVAKSNSGQTAGKDTAIGAGAAAVGDLLLNHGKVNLGHVLLGGGAGYGVSTINKAQSSAKDVKLSEGNRFGMKVERTIDSGGHY